MLGFMLTKIVDKLDEWIDFYGEIEKGKYTAWASLNIRELGLGVDVHFFGFQHIRITLLVLQLGVTRWPE